MGIPHPNHPRITADEKRPTLLFPVGYYSTSGTAFHCEDIVQRSERANHLYRTIPEVGIVVTVQTNDPFGYGKLSQAWEYGW